VKNIKKYMQKYKDKYSKQYSYIVKSSKNDEHAICTIFSADISTSHILPYFGALSPFFKLCRLASLQCCNTYLFMVYNNRTGEKSSGRTWNSAATFGA